MQTLTSAKEELSIISERRKMENMILLSKIYKEHKPLQIKRYGEKIFLKATGINYRHNILKNIMEIESKVRNLEANAAELDTNNPTIQKFLLKLKDAKKDFDLNKTKHSAISKRTQKPIPRRIFSSTIRKWKISRMR
jgi:hypothetical protein